MANVVSFGVVLLALMGILVGDIKANMQYSNEKSLFMAQLGNNGQGRLRPADCPPRCDDRCHTRPPAKRLSCSSDCQTCCAECLCVPPGTYGNKQVCPCYNRRNCP